MSTLGAGVNQAFLYDQNGTRRIASLAENVQALEWNRVLNNIGTAQVSIATGQHGDCCGVLGQVSTWGHSLVVFRDGVRCWEGPVTSVRLRRGSVVIGAHDVLGWLMKRPNSQARLVETPAYVINEASQWDIPQAFAAHDPNVLAHLQVIGAGAGSTVTRDVKAWGGYRDGMLRELVKGGLRFTVVGRRIILWHAGEVLAVLPDLIPGDHMSGDVEVFEDGFALSTGAVAANDEGLAAGYNAGIPDDFYGLVETLVPSDGTDTGTLTNVAYWEYQQHYPAPVSVNVPQGSVLDCEAPYPIESLVPGSQMTVKIEDGMCRRVEATQMLTAVKVTQGADGEQVAITVSGVGG